MVLPKELKQRINEDQGASSTANQGLHPYFERNILIRKGKFGLRPSSNHEKPFGFGLRIRLLPAPHDKQSVRVIAPKVLNGPDFSNETFVVYLNAMHIINNARPKLEKQK